MEETDSYITKYHIWKKHIFISQYVWCISVYEYFKYIVSYLFYIDLHAMSLSAKYF